MDTERFDALTRTLASPARRRTTVRLLAGGVLGALLTPLGSRWAGAQRLDGDGDGLFDEDEINVYGTRPDVFDTDGDQVGDGEEIWNRDQGMGGPSDPLVNENAAPPPAPTCVAMGGGCAQQSDCCPGQYVQCCFNVSGAGVCQDTALTSLICTNWSEVPATGCPVGMTDCGGFCTNLGTDHGNCGVCGQACTIGHNCTNGACIAQ